PRAPARARAAARHRSALADRDGMGHVDRRPCPGEGSPLPLGLPLRRMGHRLGGRARARHQRRLVDPRGSVRSGGGDRGVLARPLDAGAERTAACLPPPAPRAWRSPSGRTDHRAGGGRLPARHPARRRLSRAVRSRTVARTFLLLGSGELESWTHDVESRVLAEANGDGTVVILPTASATEGDAVFDRWGTMGLDHYAEVDVPAEILPVKRRAEAARR